MKVSIEIKVTGRKKCEGKSRKKNALKNKEDSEEENDKFTLKEKR